MIIIKSYEKKYIDDNKENNKNEINKKEIQK